MTDKPKLIAIAAVAVDGTIGIDNEIPWRILEDFKHFRETTMGGMLIVGAVTYHTLPDKAFEGREYIVLNKGERFVPKEGRKVYQFSDIDLMLMLLNNLHIDKVFVAGGASIYEALIDYCDEAIITVVNLFPDGNKFFPVGKLMNDFEILSEDSMTWLKSKMGTEYKIVHYKRKQNLYDKQTEIQ
ncbi:MAG: dihydrofolate reductase [Dehalococcoidia bacterium]|jgi:dihydrofolate reductase